MARIDMATGPDSESVVAARRLYAEHGVRSVEILSHLMQAARAALDQTEVDRLASVYHQLNQLRRQARPSEVLPTDA